MIMNNQIKSYLLLVIKQVILISGASFLQDVRTPSVCYVPQKEFIYT